MSFFSTLEIRYLSDGDPIEFDAIYERVLKVVADQSLHKDVASDLRDAFEGGRANFAITAASLRSLITLLSEICLDARFEARACGEDFRDTWVAEFKNGKPVLDEGPWN